MNLNFQQKFLLANYIKQSIQNEFREVFLTGNLARTTEIEVGDNGSVNVRIPARAYNLYQFRKRHIILFDSQESYAETVDELGGFSGIHRDYVRRCIRASIMRWLIMTKKKATVDIDGEQYRVR